MRDVPRTKADVETHREYFGNAHPAVNVKVPNAWHDATRPALLALVSEHEDGKANPHFSPAWIEDHVSDEDGERVWEIACERGWEMLQDAARETLGPVAIYSEGRMGGWAVCYDLSDIEDWDAIQFGDWQAFVRRVRDIVSDIPYQMADLIYMNCFRPWIEA